MATQLPVKAENCGKKATGYCTPKEDKQPQKMSVPPRRVLPIVFLPGIMGSNLRMTEAVQRKLKKTSNVAWRPDRIGDAAPLILAKPATRQLQLNPRCTVVDTYDGGRALTGNSAESADNRHDVGPLRVLLGSAPDSPLLVDDPVTASPRLRKQDKAKARGWGEIYFASYRFVLELCEQNLNRPGTQGVWNRILNIDPAKWNAVSDIPLSPITVDDLNKGCKGCLFPVHAMGYNWLCSSAESAEIVGNRIDQLIKDYQEKGYECTKVIVVTHSMGGLVGRALIHPSMAKRADKVLGIVHGVQPALGAPAAYRRMRCGFEEGEWAINPAPKILGNFGSEITAVLANSAGGLELLPNCAYGNGWLQIKHNDQLVESLPSRGDPYEEIYKLKDKWFGLLREEWLNPAGDEQCGIQRTCSLLEIAKSFHMSLGNTYHEQSYCHYGADSARKSWGRITWQLSLLPPVRMNWRDYRIEEDDQQGKLTIAMEGCNADRTSKISVTMGPAEDAGDQTVPAKSADAQLLSKCFKGVFRQVGYEHQASYADLNALNSTLYSIVKIAMTMTWCDDA
jgi:hypothetical protein